MAPAITHFLVGAAILLVVATPFAMVRRVHPVVPIWLVLIGGLWGLFPDIHHIAPVYADELRQFHNSPWADLFAFHYTLDRPYVRRQFYPSIIGGMVAFLAGVATYTLGSTVNPLSIPRIVTATAGILAAGLVLSVLSSPFVGGMVEVIAVFIN